jgi:hypothetical protein
MKRFPWMAPLLLVAVLGLHVGLTLYNFPPSVIFSGRPVTSFDYDTHFNQTLRTVEALRGWGKSWAWDPHINAGFPNGTIFDADNKAHELWCWLLGMLGISLPVAFNLFILLGHLLPPFVMFAAARLLRGGTWACLAAALLGSMVWNFDSMTRWAWWVGMISYGMAAVLAPLAFALFYRFLEDRKILFILLLWILLPLAHLIHPYAFIVLVVPMAVAYGAVIRKLRPLDHALIAGAGVMTVAVNLYWLVVLFSFWKFITESDVYGLADAWFLLTDYLGLVAHTENQSLLGMRSGWRILVWTLAIMSLLAWRRKRDSRFLPLAAGLGFLLAVSYLGKYFPVVRQIQPYRHVIPLTFLAAVPAALALRDMVAGIREAGRLTPAVRNMLILLAVVAAPHLIRDAIYFIPQLKPDIERPEPGLPNISDTLGFGSLGWPDQQEYRHGLPRQDYWVVRKWVVEQDDGSSRFLVQWWVLGEFLAWSTDAQIMGGFRLINLKHGFANIFRQYYYVPPPRDYLEKYIKRYAVKYLIVSGNRSPIETHSDMLRGVHFIPPAHRIYMTDENPSLFLKGDGKVTASLNRIEVTGATGDEVILKYHYLDTFVCSPGCRVEMSPVENDPIGFIRVPDPPENFVIENAYSRQH